MNSTIFPYLSLYISPIYHPLLYALIDPSFYASLIQSSLPPYTIYSSTHHFSISSYIYHPSLYALLYSPISSFIDHPSFNILLIRSSLPHSSTHLFHHPSSIPLYTLLSRLSTIIPLYIPLYTYLFLHPSSIPLSTHLFLNSFLYTPIIIYTDI